jgi:hypothetical protein
MHSDPNAESCNVRAGTAFYRSASIDFEHRSPAYKANQMTTIFGENKLSNHT